MFLERRLERMLEKLKRTAAIPLRLELWNGRAFDLASQPTVKIGVPSPSALRFLISPNLMKLGQAYVEGHLRVEGSIVEIFRVAEGLARGAASRGHKGLRRFWRHNKTRDRKAIEYHYDVSNDFYSLWLDRNMVYSCAYFRSETDTLEAAQEQKLDHVLAKLMLKPGERFLDIGCGWGTLILHAAKKYGARATGVTLSRNQYEFAARRIREEGLEGRCEVRLQDYRDVPGQGVFDKIASIGMFEHVGLRYLKGYFAKIHSLLADDGLVLNHGITSSDPESAEVGMGAGDFIHQLRVSSRRASARVARPSRNGKREARGYRRGVAAASLRADLPGMGEASGAEPGAGNRCRGRQALPHLAGVSGGLRARLRARMDEHLPGSRPARKVPPRIRCRLRGITCTAGRSSWPGLRSL